MTARDAVDASPASEAAGVIAPPPLVYLTALGAGFALQATCPAASLPGGVSWVAGAGLLVTGSLLARSFVQAFGRAETPVSPYRTSTALVTDGPYRLSRNPGYLGMALVFAGIAVLANAPWALVPLPAAIAIIDRGVIAREERYLERTFGSTYEQYKRRVRRWI